MKVLLIDDHPLILAALQSVIRGLGNDVTVVGAASAREAREVLAVDADHDLVLLDLALGDADGFEVLKEFRAAHPSLPVVVVSASDRASDVIRAVDLGAMGFVPKRASNETLFEALRLVMSGGIYIPPMTMTSEKPEPPPDGDTVPSVLRLVQDDDLQSGRSTGADGPRDGGPGPGSAPTRVPPQLGLTPRQTDVLALLLKGYSNKLIARELKVSVDTVKDHVAAVLRALNVNSRTQAVLAVSQMSQQGGAPSWRPSG